MTLQKILELLKTAPESQVDILIKKRVDEVDIEDETKVRELFDYIYWSKFDGNVTPFIAEIVNPEFTKEYPLK